MYQGLGSRAQLWVAGEPTHGFEGRLALGQDSENGDAMHDTLLSGADPEAR